MASTYLQKTNVSQTLNSKFTISVWVKRGELSSSGMNAICGSDSTGSHATQFFFDGPSLRFYDNFSSTDLVTTRKFRDTNAWYHIMAAVDTSQSTAADRVKIYVNGTQETSFATSNYPGQGDGMIININGYKFYVGTAETTGGSKFGYFDGCMSHFHFSDGQQLAPTVFGETDSTTGEWKIKTSPSFTLGNNGFTILKDGNTITDQSSNSNNFTLGAGTLTNTEDNPSNIFAILNPLLPSNPSLTNGNLSLLSGSASWLGTASTLGFSSGKFYYEVKITDVVNYTQLGVVDESDVNGLASTYVGNKAKGWGYNAGTGEYYNNGTGTSYGASYGNNDVIGIAIDADNNKLYFAKNGTWQNSGDPTSGATGTGAISISHATGYDTWFPAVSCNYIRANCNFGNGFFGSTAITSEGTNASGIGKFEYDVPTGYTALSTKGLNE